MCSHFLPEVPHENRCTPSSLNSDRLSSCCTTASARCFVVPEPPNRTPLPGINVPAVTRSARASKIIGANISRGTTSIGKIDDVLVDLDHSTVSAVVLSVGGFLGMGDKLVAVPADQIKVSSEAKFTTDLTKDQLANAPAFDPASLTR
jgi:sporulation protein YlmC with PRC-barrel domain